MFASTVNAFLGTILLGCLIIITMTGLFMRRVIRGAANVIGRLFS
jgi:hypothetical protein